jgi:hypothetical protein
MYTAPLRDKAREVAGIYDIRSVLGLRGKKRLINCPLPQHVHHYNTPSFSIIDTGGHQRFKCHGNCGLTGDVIDLVGYMDVPGYDKKNPTHVARAISLLVKDNEICIPKNKPTPRLHLNEWRKWLPLKREVAQYAKRRGLTKETLDRFKVGQRYGGMTIPCFEFGTLVCIKIRDVTGKKDLRYWSIEGSVNGMFNHDNVYLTSEPVIMTKGEIATMMLVQAGFNSCCITGGEGASSEHWRVALSHARKVIYVGDNDRDPDVSKRMVKYAEKRAQVFDADLIFPPGEYKDIDEWMLVDPSAVVAIKGWIA